MVGFLYRFADILRRPYFQNDNGRLGEDLAHRYLRHQGCTVIARNYRTRSGSGEIDIVAWHGGTLVFVEVKTRKSTTHGEPESAVDAEKRLRLQLAARDYAVRAGVVWARTRFDVISIVLERAPRIEWLRDAIAHDALTEPVRKL